MSGRYKAQHVPRPSGWLRQGGHAAVIPDPPGYVRVVCDRCGAHILTSETLIGSRGWLDCLVCASWTRIEHATSASVVASTDPQESTRTGLPVQRAALALPKHGPASCD